MRVAALDRHASPSGSARRLTRITRQARLFAMLILGLAALLPIRAVQLLLLGRGPSRLSSLFHRMLCTGLRIEVEVDGTLDRSALIVANHLSWTDILVLGGTVPATFVAKAEVRGWPLLGALARLNPALFVRRDARTAVPEQVTELASALRRGAVVLFPEGTTGAGSGVLPFRPALFAAAADGRVQPVAITYQPAGRPWRAGELADFAWDGDKAFWPHLLRVAGGCRKRCRIVALSPICMGQADRKAVAASCRSLIQERLGSTRHQPGT